MAPILTGCGNTTKTGTTEGQGAGPTLNAAIANAVNNAQAIASLSPPSFPRCPISCPVRRVGPVVPGLFTVATSGEFDVNSPTGKIRLFYVTGSLEWNVTRNCSKLKLSMVRGIGPTRRKAPGKRTRYRSPER